MSKQSYVLIRYYGETPLRVRLAQGEHKVEFEKDRVEFCEERRSKHLCGTYDFEMIAPADITPEMLEEAQVRVKKIEDEKVKHAEEMEKLNKKEAERAKKEAKMTEELVAVKNKYNKRELNNDEYQAEKKKIIAKWDKIFAGKAKPEEKPEEKEDEPEEKEAEKPKEDKDEVPDGEPTPDKEPEKKPKK